LQKNDKNMIQRKQTIYLFLAGALILISFFVPLATFIGETNSLVLYIYKVVSLVPGSETGVSPYFILPLLTIVPLITIISFLTIFLYKRRRSQLLMVRFMLLLDLTYIGLYFFHYNEVLEKLSGGIASYEYGVTIPGLEMQIPTIVFLLPLAIAMLLFLASKGIAKDEKLVRSTDRLR
jgi:uncharacterized protein DUF4293